jgi:uncharacterized protein
MATPNLYLLAADNPSAVLTHLRAAPPSQNLAASQDEHGYSLVHAAASYNHLDLLRSLANEFHVRDLRDEDGETALFVVETVEAARVLVEELGMDPAITNDEGQTARQKIEAEGDYPEVAEYLAARESSSRSTQVNGNGTAQTNGTTTTENGVAEALPPVPEGLQVTVGTMTDQEQAGPEPDPELRRRIEELAAREDFQTPEVQAELRRIVQEAISEEELAEGRNVRARQG